mgnify:CR=1 FL=1
MKRSSSRALIFAALFAVVLCVGFFAFQAVEAGSVNTGINFAAQTGLSGQDIRVTIAKIIRIILGFLGIIAVGLSLYAGFLWMTSGGNEEKIAQAKLILRNGIVGLIIILASFGIVSFILSRLIGATGGNGGNNNGNGNGNGQGIGSLGNGVVRSVYPEPFQKEVPRNTSIIVTFRETMLASSMCDTVTNDSPAKCAPGAKIKANSVKIFKTSVGDNPTSNVTNVSATSVDNLTFVFKPAAPEYLGSPIESIDYTVNLTNEVKKNNGDDAFGLSDFRWSFEVSNLLDLVSPKIKSVGDAGVFPLPDDEGDIVSGISQAKAAEGTITINGAPSTYVAASASVQRLVPPSPPVNAAVEGTNTCADGIVTITIIPQGATLGARIGYTQPGLLPTDLAITNNRIAIAPCGLTLALTPGFAAGHTWRITVQAEKQSDTLTIGSKIYSFVSANPNNNQIRVGGTNAQTATNIAAAVNSIHPEMTAPTVNGAVVTLRAKVAGVNGNSLELSASNLVALGISRMQGGTDQTTSFSIKDKQDQPKNSVIQINFNEAINPLVASGTSDELANILRVVNADAGARAANAACASNNECLSYNCSNNVCQGSQLAGVFTISNQYRTVEFISDIKCGVNGCGENIYCLPGNSNLKVETKAASLQACTSNSDCNFAPYTTCSQGVCSDSANNKNLPTAPVQNGIVDLADNSLDGNRNDNPQGQANAYNENATVQDNGGRGDNHFWSFWISDRLDLTPPKILGTGVNNNQSNVNKTTPIEVIFSKLMMSSSLTTGSITVDNGINQVVHKLINLWSLANDPIGYWTSKQDRDVDPLDGRPDRTSVFLGHGDFNDATLYQSQVGSGVKDIYQNCYKPSAGPNCNANALQPSCCRDASGNLVPTANLSPDGNCL